MSAPRHPGGSGDWFVALPDTAAAAAVATALAGSGVRTVTHPSGRPWLVGRWPEAALLTATAGRTVLAVLGRTGLSPDTLAHHAARTARAADADRLATSLTGSAHLLASVDGAVRVQGTVTGVRRVFAADAGGVPVAADRADVLAALTGAALDEARLALHLMQPHALHPLAGLPVWSGVTAVPGDSYLVLDGATRREVRWWAPPEPVLPMAEGAPALRDALAAAVAARVDGRELVSCDLGGLDSTAICSLAARGPATVAAYTAASRDPLADDVVWAQRTAAALPRVEHHVLAAEELPLVFAGLSDPVAVFDEPCSATVDLPRLSTIAGRAAGRGSPVHLVGFGGDELLYGSVAHLHDLLRTHPRAATRALRGFTAKYRWPRGDVLRQLADRRPYRAWLADVARSLTDRPWPGPHDPLLEWGFRVRLPPWATPDAVEAVRAQITAAARDVEPVSPRRGQQRELETMRYLSRMTRQLAQVTGTNGVELAAPYYDDRVVEAGLAVRTEDRVTPWAYKPLIVEAMRGIVPEAVLARQTKANGSGDVEPGLRAHRAELLELWSGSRLGTLGLVDAAALAAACTRPLPPDLQFGALDQAVACEVWLRSLEPATLPAGGPR